MVASRSGRPARRLAPDRHAIETEKYDPSLPLAFKVARLFKKRIEQIFESDKD